MAKQTIHLGYFTLEAEPAKRGGLRWAVGSPDGPRSATWRLWGNKKGDVYLAVRNLGGILKTSFHHDGKCHTGFTAEYAPEARERFEGFSSRHLDEWRLPDEDGLLRATQIAVPRGDLRAFASRESKQMTWVPAPPEDSLAVVSIYFAPPRSVERWPGWEDRAQPLGLITNPLRNTWVVFASNPIDEGTRASIEQLRVTAKSLRGFESAPKKPDTRAIAWGSRNGSGERFFLDLAWA